MKIGLFYGSTTCYTEIAAEKIQGIIGEEIIDLYNIKDHSLTLCDNYDYLIFGISTWDFGQLQEDWESSWDDIKNLNLSGKTIALYGLGDQVGYSQWFQDGLGMLFDEICAHHQVKIIGLWPNQGYEFEHSKALTADKSHFVGLSLDEDSQYQLSDQRIEKWSLQVLEEIAAQL
jgi:flavodoxin II